MIHAAIKKPGLETFIVSRSIVSVGIRVVGHRVPLVTIRVVAGIQDHDRVIQSLRVRTLTCQQVVHQHHARFERRWFVAVNGFIYPNDGGNVARRSGAGLPSFLHCLMNCIEPSNVFGCGNGIDP